MVVETIPGDPGRGPAVWHPAASIAGAVLHAAAGGDPALQAQGASVAAVLRGYGLTSLLLDISPIDSASPLQAMSEAASWLQSRHLGGQVGTLGLMLSGSAADAGLRLASECPPRFAAIVVWGGAVGLPADTLRRVHIPTLLIGGGLDLQARQSQQAALALLAGPKRLEVVPGTGHALAAGGALGTVAHLAAHWFMNHLG